MHTIASRRVIDKIIKRQSLVIFSSVGDGSGCVNPSDFGFLIAKLKKNF